MSKQTDAERQQARRDRARREGLVKMECWVTPEDRERIRAWLAGECPLRQKKKPRNRRAAAAKPTGPKYYIATFKADTPGTPRYKLKQMGFAESADKSSLYVREDAIKPEHVEDARRLVLKLDGAFHLKQMEP